MFHICAADALGSGLGAGWYNDYRQAVAAAKREGKPLLADFSTEWCPSCRNLEKYTLAHPAITSRLEKFVKVHVDGDAHRDMVSQFNVSGFPTLVAISPKGYEINRRVGYVPAESLASTLDDAVREVGPVSKTVTPEVQLAKNSPCERPKSAKADEREESPKGKLAKSQAVRESRPVQLKSDKDEDDELVGAMAELKKVKGKSAKEQSRVTAQLKTSTDQKKPAAERSVQTAGKKTSAKPVVISDRAKTSVASSSGARKGKLSPNFYKDVAKPKSRSVQVASGTKPCSRFTSAVFEPAVQDRSARIVAAATESPAELPKPMIQGTRDSADSSSSEESKDETSQSGKSASSGSKSIKDPLGVIKVLQDDSEGQAQPAAPPKHAGKASAKETPKEAVKESKKATSDSSAGEKPKDSSKEPQKETVKQTREEQPKKGEKEKGEKEKAQSASSDESAKDTAKEGRKASAGEERGKKQDESESRQETSQETASSDSSSGNSVSSDDIQRWMKDANSKQKADHKREARAMYAKIVEADPSNQFGQSDLAYIKMVALMVDRNDDNLRKQAYEKIKEFLVRFPESKYRDYYTVIRAILAADLDKFDEAHSLLDNFTRKYPNSQFADLANSTWEDLPKARSKSAKEKISQEKSSKKSSGSSQSSDSKSKSKTKKR